MTSTGEPTHATTAKLLSSAAAALAHGIDLDVTLGAILDGVVAAVGATTGVVLLRDPDRVEFEAAAAVGVSADATAQLAQSATAADHPIAAAVGGAAIESGGRDGTDANGQPARLLEQPLIVSREGIDLPLGALQLGWPPATSLDPSTVELARAAADLLAVAVDHARLSSMVAERAEWFERLAHTDALTGLANLRTFNRVLELELARAARQGGEVSVAVFDVDGFAATNEQAGRDVGDDVLRAVASVLAESIRLVDTVARAGADEFIVVAPGAAGQAVARRVIESVGRLAPVQGHVTTVSAGIARFPADGTTADGLIGAAREAMLQARGQGPGQIGSAPFAGEATS